MNYNTINIRAIQHYMYCPRRFALLEVNDDWAENSFVVKANIQHQHVHDGSHSYSDSRKIVRSNIVVYNDEPVYDIFGITDCIEFIRSSEGVELSDQDGRFHVHIIEYKPKAPKEHGFNETDAIQVFAQKVCADSIWNCDSEAYIYYSDIRKREEKCIPSRKKGQKCSGCSMSDVCFPKEKKYCVRDIVMSQKGADIL